MNLISRFFSNTFAKDTLWNLLGNVFPIIVGLWSIPFLLKSIGFELFGILTIIWSIIGYFSLFDLGLGRAITYLIAMNRDKNILHHYKTFSESLGMSVLFGFVGTIILIFFSEKLAYCWLGISAINQCSVFNTLLLTAIAIPLTTMTSILKGTLEGFELFRILNIVKILFGISNFVVPAVVVYFCGSNIILIVLGLVLTRFVFLIIHFIILRNCTPIRKIYIKLHVNSQLLKIGSGMTVSTIIGPMMVLGDRFLMSYVLGVDKVAFYSIPFDLVVKLIVIPASFSSMLYPKISAINNGLIIGGLYKKSRLIISLIMTPICLFVYFFSFQILNLWLGSNVANSSYMILSCLSIGVLFNSISQVPFTFLHSIGKVWDTAFIHIFEIAIYTVLLLFSLHYYGIIGAGFAFTIRCAIDYILLNHFLNKRLNHYGQGIL
jgi:O-antigen/teichoic acid export membrane protein